jgi:hypothetical protein
MQTQPGQVKKDRLASTTGVIKKCRTRKNGLAFKSTRCVACGIRWIRKNRLSTGIDEIPTLSGMP